MDDQTDIDRGREALAEIVAGLDGVTPGPWYPGHLGDDSTTCQCTSIVEQEYAGGIASIHVSNGIDSISEGGNEAPPEQEASANMRHLARCDPAAIRAIAAYTASETARADAAQAENARLREALAYYTGATVMQFRCGDVVKHRPSGEKWVVAYHERNHIGPAGWPPSEAEAADCVLVEPASDAVHESAVRMWYEVKDDARRQKVARNNLAAWVTVSNAALTSGGK